MEVMMNRLENRAAPVRDAAFFDVFTAAARYAAWCRPGPDGRVCDPPPRLSGFTAPFGERLLQCVWYDPALRPPRLVTTDGEFVTVENAGVWNLEAGPDFLGASILLGPDRRRIKGDVEVHVRAPDWRNHGHETDPRYRGVRVHVTFDPPATSPAGLPPGVLQVPLRDALATSGRFSFEDIDAASYPYHARRDRTPCRDELAFWPPDSKESLLDSAGEERLRRKTERMALAVREKGEDQVFYEEFLVALGYRHNKNPFRRLAAAIPLGDLLHEAEGDPLAATGLLSGAAGLLPDSARPEWEPDSRLHLRELWLQWWKRRDRYSPRALTRKDWQLSGLRPLNHPLRRLAGAAAIFTREPAPLAAVLRESRRRPDRLLAAAIRHWTVADGFWSRRLSWSGSSSRTPAALIGRDRITAIVANVCVPLLATRDGLGDMARDIARTLPPESISGLVRESASTLFGADHPPSWYRNDLRRQGLLQIFHDFCLNDRSRCSECAFPRLLREHREAGELTKIAGMVSRQTSQTCPTRQTGPTDA